MKPATFVKAVILIVAGCAHSVCHAQAIVNTDFSKGSFEAQGWKPQGAWDVFTYPPPAVPNPGPVARFAANQPEGSLTKTFDEIRNPARLTLSLDYGWGWGDAGQAADAVGLMLLDSRGHGYIFEVHRCRAKWAVQWARVEDRQPPGDKTWATEEIDATQAAVRDGGGLSRLVITRESDGSWSISNSAWNKGSGGSVRFTDTSTTSFSQLVLRGTHNFDEQVFNKIVLATGNRAAAAATTAIPVGDFLSSLGVVTTFPDRGQPLANTISMIQYAGFRWVRGGIEGLSTSGPTTVQTFLDLHRQTGVRFSWGLVSGGTDLDKLLTTARQLATADALLAFEGNNEPNNWGVTYQGEPGGGRAPSWMAVAKLQRDLYRAVKSDPMLNKYPVWSISEGGAETDNVGLQFLTIPVGGGARLPDGTQFADYANVHNYIYHPGAPGLADNKTWNAADPTAACKIDGLYGNYGVTWGRHFRGYSETELLTLPRVTTETGCTIADSITEEIQALNLLSMYLDQFKRGWRHTAVYLLRDRTDEGGNQSFGFFKPDYTPRKAALYLHNLTTILADAGATATPGRLNYALSEQPATVHEMLLQKSNGVFQLVVWGERLKGGDDITVHWGGVRAAVKVYDPTRGTDPVQTTDRAESLQLTVSDHPFVIAIVPE